MLVGVVGLGNDIFIVFEFEPREPVEDRACRFLGRACNVGVLYPQQEFTAGVAGVKIVKKCGPGGADM